ncbi:MAG: SpoIIE family protein phosphatase [Bdellovibrionaceae bacterium]|nr:SpoIIE family protein phosphatase [Bdellovibrionales bacterium]MCB9084928.1 SpoIIE family protein phosphatase [Pseudobdellovibrionaceae bacterium]
MSGQENETHLKKRIQELEGEVRQREEDLARFRRELSEANSRLENLIAQVAADLKSAENIQRLLVPTEFPNISGLEFSTKFIPSAVSGGDYFDIFEHDDPMHFGIVAASSSGYSTSALFMSVLLKMSARMEARRGSAPHEILNLLAGDLRAGLREGDKIDIFYALIDRRTFELHYCRLGDVVALTQDYASGELKPLKSSGGMITNEFSDITESHKVALNPRDRLVVCTRGISGVTNADGEVFGQERVVKAVLEGPKRGVHELRNQILYQTQKFGQYQEPKRDQTVIVAEVKDRVIKLAKN